MYDILRIFIIIIVLTIYFLLVRKRINTVTLIIAGIVGFIVYLNLYRTPIERNFVGFNTVEDAIKYQYSIRLDNETIDIIKRENSALVKFEYDTFPFLFEKENGKWRMYSEKDVNIKKKAIIEEGYNIAKIESKTENKTYIILINTFYEEEIKEQEISDSNNSKFEITKTKIKNKIKNKDIFNTIFYTIIDSNIQNYELYVNGRTIKF